MTDHITPIRASQFADHPLILKALAAVEAAGSLKYVRASAHISSRLYYPSHVEAIAAERFFPGQEDEITEASYERALRILDKLRAEMAF